MGGRADPNDLQALLAAMLEAERARADADDGAARRVSTMLMLSAAADRNPIAFARALARHDVDRELVGRLGGVEAWAPPDEPAFALVLHALMSTPSDWARALDVLAALRRHVTAKDALTLVDAGVACARRSFRATPADQWESTLPAATAVLNLCDAVTRGGIALDGRSGGELLNDMLERAASTGTAVSFDDHTDAEILLGFLGAGASRSRVAVWEIPARGDLLVRAAMQRIRHDAGAARHTNEGVHWGIALLDRAHRREVDPRYVELAKKLLAAAAGPAAPDLLRAFGGRPAAPGSNPGLRPREERDDGDSARTRANPETRFAPPASAPPSIVRSEGRMSRPKRSGAADKRISRLVHPDGPSAAADARRARARPESRLRRVRTLLAGLANGFERHWRRVRAPRVGHPAVPLPAGAARRSMRAVHAVRTAAVIVVVGGVVAGAIVVRRDAGGVAPVEARAPAPDARLSTDGARAADAVPAEPPLAEVLAGAKAWAAAGEWDRVIGMLSNAGPAWTRSFAWDSLLTQAALHQARRLPPGDARRNALLGTARDRATLALASVPPFAHGSDLLRLLRAEACIIGELGCDSAALTEDLLLAARSPNVAVSERASALLESVKP